MKFLLILLCLFSLFGCSKKESADIFAMDTVISLDIYGKNSDIVIPKMESEIKRLDKKFAPKSDMIFDTETNYLIDTANSISKASDNAFNVQLFDLIDLWGFYDKNYTVPTDTEIKTALGGQNYDFGGIAKGYAGDNLLKIAKADNIKSGILSLGGNIVAIGSRPDGNPWNVGICNPSDISDYLGYVKVSDKAVVTAGAYQRYFEKDGKRYHHIFNPKTGYPADSGLLSVTVISESGILADALSTAIFVGGTELLDKLYTDNQFDFEAVIVLEDGEIYTTQNANFYREE